MATPVLSARIDFNNDGDFLDATETVSDRVLAANWTRGRSADFSTEAIGELKLTLQNDDGFLTESNLIPGLPVHAHATYFAVEYPVFFGYLERATFNPRDRTVDVTAYDPLRRLAETDIVVPPNAYATHTGLTMRRAVLEDAERGTRNLLVNPSFETNTTGWEVSTPGTLTRTATDAAPGAGTAYGSFVATAADQRAYTFTRLAPILFADTVYRFSVYLKAASAALWRIGFGPTLGDAAFELTVPVTTAWQRLTITHTLVADLTGSGSPLVAWIESTAAGTVGIDAAMITRGQALYPYADAGTGRWPSWVGNGDFEGNAASAGWGDAFGNLIGNPSFETNTAGWVAGADGFMSAGAVLSRQTTNVKYGVGAATQTGGSGNGSYYDLSGITFKAGVAYTGSVWIEGGSGRIWLGSNGTIADSVTSGSTSGAYARVAVTWTPTADRTDVHLSVQKLDASAQNFDGAMVTSGPAAAPYADTGPGGGGVAPTTQLIFANFSKYGYQSHLTTTPAIANVGLVYDFNHYGSFFVSAQPYTASLWLYPVGGNMPYRIGIAANKGDGTFDEASATGTATGDTWTKVTVPWTPTADRNSSAVLTTLLYAYQTDATARDFVIDGVRVIPGSVADDFEMSHWTLPTTGGEAQDRYLATASLSGSGLASLATLNGLTLTRHWIEPAMASPWYRYMAVDRDAVGASAETFLDSSVNGFDFADVEVDRASIVNVQQVSWDGGTEYYGDAASVDLYDPRPGSAIDGSAFFPDRTIPDEIGPAMVARYSTPRYRPTMTVENRWPSQLERELNDTITVTSARAGVAAREYLVLRIDGEMSNGGLTWRTAYVLEEA